MKKVTVREILTWYALLIIAFIFLISSPASAQVTIGLKGTGQYWQNKTTISQNVVTEGGVHLPKSTETTIRTTEAYLMASPFIRYDYQIQESPFFGSLELSLSDRSFEALKIDLSATFKPMSMAFRSDNPDLLGIGISFDYDAGYNKTIGICPVIAVNLPIECDIDFMVGFEFNWDVFRRHSRAELKFSFPLNL